MQKTAALIIIRVHNQVLYQTKNGQLTKCHPKYLKLLKASTVIQFK